MSDLDADLLALADGDDSGEEGPVQIAEKAKSESYSPPASAPSARPATGRSVTPKKARPRATARKSKRTESDEDVK